MKCVASASSNPLKEGSMFERYTEGARRVIFNALLEARQHGAFVIETEHLLLGLLRENESLIHHLLRPEDSTKVIRHELVDLLPKDQPKHATSLELPLSLENKRILAYAAEEAERLQSRLIGCEHLLLGILREVGCQAERILQNHGLELTLLREIFRVGSPGQAGKPGASFVPIAWPEPGIVPNEETATRIAEAVLAPVFGQARVDRQKPFAAELKDQLWRVRGDASNDRDDQSLTVTIDKADGRVLWVGLETEEE
jgi:hypothetical protein